MAGLRCRANLDRGRPPTPHPSTDLESKPLSAKSSLESRLTPTRNPVCPRRLVTGFGRLPNGPCGSSPIPDEITVIAHWPSAYVPRTIDMLVYLKAMNPRVF